MIININELSSGAVSVTPIEVDWNKLTYEEYECREACKCNECGGVLIGSYGGERHNDLDTDTECEGYVEEGNGPAMNYAYELPRTPTDEEIEKLVDLPLCVVHVDGTDYLALTGGGMDLSWEICEAYIVLGCLPPAHFSGLPIMAGMELNERTEMIISACEAAANMMLRMAENKLHSLGELRKSLKEATNE